MKIVLTTILVACSAIALGGKKSDKPVEGFADEQGNFVSDKAETADAVVKPSDWGTTPLGAPGKLVLDNTFRKKPVFTFFLLLVA